MTDKRSESERVSARPPLPSIAPPTDDIDSEWGGDELPAVPNAPAPVPQPSATATPAPAQRISTAAPASTPAARLPTPVPVARSSASPRPASSPGAAPRPASSAPPVARASVPVAQAPEPSSATATPIVSNPLATATPVVGNPLRKQTLLGIAPVVAPRSEPPAAASSSAPAALAAPPATPAVASSPPHADGPLRKQTLFGIAPVLPSTPATTAGSPAPAALPEVIPPARVAETEPAAPSIATAGAGAASDAPFTSSARSSAATPLPRVPERTSDAELPPLRSRRPRWVLPLAVAAVVGVGIVGLRRLDHASIPGALPAAPAAEVRKAPPLVEQTNTPVTTPAAPSSTTPANDDTDDSRPPPTTPPEPLKAPSAPLPVTSAAVVGDTPAGTLVPVRIQSDPPGARMFRKGKEVGTTPFTLEFPAGERFSYELGLPGYITRKVVIDGSKSEITIGMRPEAATAPGASSRK